VTSDYQPDEAEIESSRAPLLDHLVELRKRLIICVGALILGFGICFGFADDIYTVLLQPFVKAGALIAAQKAGVSHGPFDLLLTLVLREEVDLLDTELRLTLVRDALQATRIRDRVDFRSGLLELRCRLFEGVERLGHECLQWWAVARLSPVRYPTAADAARTKRASKPVSTNSARRVIGL
jgi:hypothetical protein